LVIGSFFLLRAVVFTKEIKSPFEPTPIPTRVSGSYALEGETHFDAGNLTAAIEAYARATKAEPNNAQIWSELARIQAYSSASLTTDGERRIRLQEALASINAGLKVDVDSSLVHAVRAFVLDWNANPALSGVQSPNLLNEAEQEALRALQLDKNNTLALAYYAEILVDQQKWAQADQYIKLALERNEPLVDVYRVNAYVEESLGNYAEAIKNYKKASEIMPNMTFLYIYTGYNYRQLRQYTLALEYFEKAININKQLGLSDPIPYLAIGKTYSQMGEFFSAARNVKAALNIDPSNPEVYGSLGVVYFKNRNYEGAITALKCAVKGCNPTDSCDVRQCKDATNPSIEIKGLELTANSVVYYYTYGSVLAGMHRTAEPYCQDAVPVLQEVRQAFKADTTILAIIEPSENICASFGYR
jgi:tetratricopeptide (TPR) repeat protein